METKAFFKHQSTPCHYTITFTMVGGQLILALGIASCMAQADPQVGTAAGTQADLTQKEIADMIGKAKRITQKFLKSHKGKQIAMKGRRLSAPDYSTMCENACFKDVKNGMITMLTAVETHCPAPTPVPCPTPAPSPQASTSSAADPSSTNGALNTVAATTTTADGARRLDESTTQVVSTSEGAQIGGGGSAEESDCVFDACALMATMCDEASTMAQITGGDQCIQSTFDFMCNGLCSASCTDPTKSVEERKLFCSPGDSGESGGEEYEEPPECGAQDDSTPDAKAMGEMFNFMCLKNSEKNFFCMTKGAEFETAGAFEGSADEEFPNPCAVDCSTATGQAIKEMGCCMGSLLAVGEKHGMMTHAELISAKAATYKCGGQTAMIPCTDANAGLVMPTAAIVGSMAVDTCPATKAETMAKQVFIANALQAQPKQVSIMACPRDGVGCKGSGRRLSGASVEYTVTVTGTDAQVQAQITAMETKAAEIGVVGDTQESGTGTSQVSGSDGESLNLLAGLVTSMLWCMRP